jgi:hypothetical protein
MSIPSTIKTNVENKRRVIHLYWSISLALLRSRRINAANLGRSRIQRGLTDGKVASEYRRQKYRQKAQSDDANNP